MPIGGVPRKNKRQVDAYQFLQDRARSQEPFTCSEAVVASGWKESTVNTHLNKQLRDFMERLDERYRVKKMNVRYRVRREFLRLTIDDFLELMKQTKSVYPRYRRARYDTLVSYEFLLPLTREDRLRQALDDLFYSDTITRRLREIGLDKVQGIVPRTSDLGTDEEYIRHICAMVSDRFVGYSISHVNGRFRAENLTTRDEASTLLVNERRYIIDETTAVVRFLIKCNVSRLQYGEDIPSIMAAISDDPRPDLDREELRREVHLIRALFFSLFAEAVVRTIDGEDEIWLLESGQTHRLYVWERTRQREALLAE